MQVRFCVLVGLLFCAFAVATHAAEAKVLTAHGKLYVVAAAPSATDVVKQNTTPAYVGVDGSNLSKIPTNVATLINDSVAQNMSLAGISRYELIQYNVSALSAFGNATDAGQFVNITILGTARSLNVSSVLRSVTNYTHLYVLKGTVVGLAGSDVRLTIDTRTDTMRGAVWLPNPLFPTSRNKTIEYRVGPVYDAASDLHAWWDARDQTVNLWHKDSNDFASGGGLDSGSLVPAGVYGAVGQSPPPVAGLPPVPYAAFAGITNQIDATTQGASQEQYMTYGSTWGSQYASGNGYGWAGTQPAEAMQFPAMSVGTVVRACFTVYVGVAVGWSWNAPVTHDFTFKFYATNPVLVSAPPLYSTTVTVSNNGVGADSAQYNQNSNHYNGGTYVYCVTPGWTWASPQMFVTMPASTTNDTRATGDYLGFHLIKDQMSVPAYDPNGVLQTPVTAATSGGVWVPQVVASCLPYSECTGLYEFSVKIGTCPVCVGQSNPYADASSGPQPSTTLVTYENPQENGADVPSGFVYANGLTTGTPPCTTDCPGKWGKAYTHTAPGTLQQVCAYTKSPVGTGTTSVTLGLIISPTNSPLASDGTYYDEVTLSATEAGGWNCAQTSIVWQYETITYVVFTGTAGVGMDNQAGSDCTSGQGTYKYTSSGATCDTTRRLYIAATILKDTYDYSASPYGLGDQVHRPEDAAVTTSDYRDSNGNALGGSMRAGMALRVKVYVTGPCVSCQPTTAQQPIGQISYPSWTQWYNQPEMIAEFNLAAKPMWDAGVILDLDALQSQTWNYVYSDEWEGSWSANGLNGRPTNYGSEGQTASVECGLQSAWYGGYMATVPDPRSGGFGGATGYFARATNGVAGERNGQHLDLTARSGGWGDVSGDTYDVNMLFVMAASRTSPNINNVDHSYGCGHYRHAWMVHSDAQADWNTNVLTLAHELGHVMGSSHDTQTYCTDARAGTPQSGGCERVATIMYPGAPTSYVMAYSTVSSKQLDSGTHGVFVDDTGPHQGYGTVAAHELVFQANDQVNGCCLVSASGHSLGIKQLVIKQPRVPSCFIYGDANAYPLCSSSAPIPTDWWASSNAPRDNGEWPVQVRRVGIWLDSYIDSSMPAQWPDPLAGPSDTWWPSLSSWNIAPVFACDGQPANHLANSAVCEVGHAGGILGGSRRASCTRGDGGNYDVSGPVTHYATKVVGSNAICSNHVGLVGWPALTSTELNVQAHCEETSIDDTAACRVMWPNPSGTAAVPAGPSAAPVGADPATWDTTPGWGGSFMSVKRAW